MSSNRPEDGHQVSLEEVMQHLSPEGRREFELATARAALAAVQAENAALRAAIGEDQPGGDKEAVPGTD